MTIMTSTIMAPALNQIAEDLHMNPVESQQSLSIYVLSIAIGPLIISPFSEVYGRLPIFHACNIWFLIWNLVCGAAKSKGLLITARLFAGLGGSLDYAISISVLGDCFGPDQRGLSLGLYNFIPLLGTVAGPIIGGFSAQNLSWRWLFWIVSIVQGAVIALSVFTFSETHEPTILKRKAAKFRKSTGNNDLYTAMELKNQGKSIRGELGRSLSRPLRLLFTHPLIQALSLLFAYNYGVLFFVVSTFADLWTSIYHESVQISGLNYIAFVIGELTGAGLCAPATDIVWKYLKKKYNSTVTPEYRVPLMLPGAILIPAGLFWYGWSAEKHVFWLVPDIGVGVLACGLMSSSMSIDGYVIDAYPEHVASANAAASFLSSVFGFVFPLFAPKVYGSLGYGWGNSVLGFIAIFLGIIGPAGLWTFGARLRAKSKSSY